MSPLAFPTLLPPVPPLPQVRTDEVEGFLLDRGFQIFLTSYPEARAALDYDALALRPFYAGASVRHAGAWHCVADPVRHPLDGLGTLVAPGHPIGTVADKLRVGVFRLRSLLGSVDELLAAPEVTTLQRLQVGGCDGVVVWCRGGRGRGGGA